MREGGEVGGVEVFPAGAEGFDVICFWGCHVFFRFRGVVLIGSWRLIGVVDC